MITYVVGDLFKSPARAIVNTVNKNFGKITFACTFGQELQLRTKMKALDRFYSVN
jgi:O-acetyl-ADP-ribose deacetylase (regulator of RNase III)